MVGARAAESSREVSNSGKTITAARAGGMVVNRTIGMMCPESSDIVRVGRGKADASSVCHIEAFVRARVSSLDSAIIDVRTDALKLSFRVQRAIR